jgi:hypothetical protein
VRTALKAAFLLVLVIIGLTAWVGVRGWLAKDHLQNSANLVARLQTQLEQGTTAPAQATVVRMQHETADASRLTNDRVWRAATHFPGFGDDLAAVHAVSVSGHTLATDSLPSVALAAADVHQLRNSSAVLAPAQVLAAAKRVKVPLTTAQAGVVRAQSQISAVDPDTLFGPVRSGVQQLNTGLAQFNAELRSLITLDSAVLKGGRALTH